MTAATPPDEPPVIRVDATEDVGSDALAAALADHDVAAIGRALRHDVVIVPILQRDDGEIQTRVFEAPPGSAKTYEACLFSSTTALAAFLVDAPVRDFAVQRGQALIPFLSEHAGVIERVVFDPAGPHPMTATPQDVLAVLAPHDQDDDVAWVTRGEATGGAGPDRREPRRWWRRRRDDD